MDRALAVEKQFFTNPIKIFGGIVSVTYICSVMNRQKYRYRVITVYPDTRHENLTWVATKAAAISFGNTWLKDNVDMINNHIIIKNEMNEQERIILKHKPYKK